MPREWLGRCKGLFTIVEVLGAKSFRVCLKKTAFKTSVALSSTAVLLSRKQVEAEWVTLICSRLNKSISRRSDDSVGLYIALAFTPTTEHQHLRRTTPLRSSRSFARKKGAAR